MTKINYKKITEICSKCIKSNTNNKSHCPYILELSLLNYKKIKDDTNLIALEKLPFYSSDKPLYFHSLILLPTDSLHDSGYKSMDFVAVLCNMPLVRLSGYSDALHLNGIGGLGERNQTFSNLDLRNNLNID